MKKNRRSISIKKSIIIGFILTMLLSIGSIGYMVFTNWYSSASRTTESIAEDLNERIYNQLYSFMHVPEHINEVNFRIIDNGILELSDESLRDKFFVGVLDSHDKEIYSFSYGTVDGEYYGASRNEEGVIEIVRSNSETGGNLWSYRVDDEMTAGRCHH